jgi:hypothetical protein
MHVVPLLFPRAPWKWRWLVIQSALEVFVLNINLAIVRNRTLMVRIIHGVAGVLQYHTGAHTGPNHKNPEP